MGEAGDVVEDNFIVGFFAAAYTDGKGHIAPGEAGRGGGVGSYLWVFHVWLTWCCAAVERVYWLQEGKVDCSFMAEAIEAVD